MKTLLLVSLIVLGSPETWASPCRKQCKAEYRDCIADVKASEAEDKKNMNPSFGPVIEFNSREAKATCYDLKKQCFEDCRR